MDMGPDDQLNETRKVSKLMAAWQVPSLMHLDSIVQSNPEFKHDFEATVTYLSGQLSHQSLRHGGGPGRNIHSVETQGNSGSSKSEVKKLKREIKALKKGHGGKDSGDKPKVHKSNKTNQAAKFSRSNPGAHIPPNEWKKLTAEQREAARKARERDGISTTRNNGTLATGNEERTVSVLRAVTMDSALAEGTDDLSIDAPRQLLAATHVPPHMLESPPGRSLMTTQRQELYKKGSKRKRSTVQFSQDTKGGGH